MRIDLKKYWVMALVLIAMVGGGARITGHAQQYAEKDMIPMHLSVAVTPNKFINVVALMQGFYKKNGLDVQQYISPGSAKQALDRAGVIVNPEFVRERAVNEDVTDKSTPFTIGGGVPTINADAKTPGPGARIIVLTTEDMTNWPIITNKSIVRPDQLIGKKLGVSSLTDTAAFQARLFVKTMGWDVNKDITLVTGVDNLGYLKSGAVDAMLGDELTDYVLSKGNTEYHALVNLKDWKAPMASNSLNVDRAWLQADPRNREETRRLVKSMVDAIAYIKQDKTGAFRIMANVYGIKDPQMQERFYEASAGPNVPRKPYPSLAGIKKDMELFDSPEMRQHKPEDFYDNSFVGELDKSGYIDSLYK